jgi:hypothetical protein
MHRLTLGNRGGGGVVAHRVPECDLAIAHGQGADAAMEVAWGLGTRHEAKVQLRDVERASIDCPPIACA